MEITAVIIVELIIIVAVIAGVFLWKRRLNENRRSACRKLNIGRDLSGKRVLCPPNAAGHSWGHVGDAGIVGTASCKKQKDGSYLCDRCIGSSKPADYPAMPSIGFDGVWPNFQLL